MQETAKRLKLTFFRIKISVSPSAINSLSFDHRDNFQQQTSTILGHKATRIFRISWFMCIVSLAVVSFVPLKAIRTKNTSYELTTRKPGAVYFKIGSYAVQNVPLYLALDDGMLYFPLLDSQPDFLKYGFKEYQRKALNSVTQSIFILTGSGRVLASYMLPLI
jgi:hypothetical protein